jgi:hypothetical protein
MQARVRRIFIAATAILITSLVGVWLLLKYSPEVTLVFTEEQLQKQLEPRFPSKKCLLGSCVELVGPRLSLKEGADRVEIETSFTATLGSRTMPGVAKFSGRPHYEQGSGNFYLRDVEVTEFTMSGNAPDFDEVVKVRGPRIVAAVMSGFPLYSVQSHPEYGAVAKLALRRVSVVSGQLQVVFANPLLLFRS